jgi:hypothetical protein
LTTGGSNGAARRTMVIIIWDTRRRGRLKIQPTVGEDEIPVDANEPVQQRRPMSAVVSQDGAAAVRDRKT